MLLLTYGGTIFNEATNAGWSEESSLLIAIVGGSAMVLLSGWLKERDRK